MSNRRPNSYCKNALNVVFAGLEPYVSNGGAIAVNTVIGTGETGRRPFTFWAMR
jgi:hypothetical protein